jgi:hypothetical protein
VKAADETVGFATLGVGPAVAAVVRAIEVNEDLKVRQPVALRESLPSTELPASSPERGRQVRVDAALARASADGHTKSLLHEPESTGG